MRNLGRLVRDISPQPAILHINANVPCMFDRLQPFARSNLIVITTRDDRHRSGDPDVVFVDGKAFEPKFGTREAIEKFSFRAATAIAVNMNVVPSCDPIENCEVGVEQRPDAHRLNGEHLINFRPVGGTQAKTWRMGIFHGNSEKRTCCGHASQKTTGGDRQDLLYSHCSWFDRLILPDRGLGF